MFKKKAIFGVLLVVIVVVLFMVGAKVFSNEAGVPYDSYNPSIGTGHAKDLGNINAWYDETWQAADYYVLVKEISVPVPGSDQYHYEHTTTPTTNPPFPASPYENDIVVTKWQATGHLHFGSTAPSTP